MGHWHHRCGLTHLPICAKRGPEIPPDDVVCWVTAETDAKWGEDGSWTQMVEPCTLRTPVTLGFEALYAGCSHIEEVSGYNVAFVKDRFSVDEPESFFYDVARGDFDESTLALFMVRRDVMDWLRESAFGDRATYMDNAKRYLDGVKRAASSGADKEWPALALGYGWTGRLFQGMAFMISTGLEPYAGWLVDYLRQGGSVEPEAFARDVADLIQISNLMNRFGMSWMPGSGAGSQMEPWSDHVKFNQFVADLADELDEEWDEE